METLTDRYKKPILNKKQTQENFSIQSLDFFCGQDSQNGNCCFNHLIGLPVKNEKPLPIFDYEMDLFDILKNKKLLFIKKSTGLGITEFVLRWIIYKALTDSSWKNSQVCIVTAPRLELAMTLIDRIHKMIPKAEHKSTRIVINSVTIEAFPSHHLDTMRGLANPKCIFLDEADFFPVSQQSESLVIAERYLAKSNPHIILVSTPNIPNGMFDKIEHDEKSIYHKKLLPYTVGLDKIFTNEDIELAKQSPSFEREYNLRYGGDDGNIFPNELVNAITTDYDLSIKNGEKILAIDPAYGSSNFAIVGGEKVDGIVQIKLCEQIQMASPTAMAERIVKLAETYPTVLVDSAGTGLITDLQLKGIDATKMVFSKLLNDMTINASRMVKEKQVVIHPAFTDLIADLKSVRYNEKGHPDKKKLLFDLGDSFLMLCHGFNAVKRTSVINLGQ